MDAVSFIASVAQLAGAGLALSTALYEYASSVSNAPKKLNDLAQDVKLTSSVLEHLSEVLSEATLRAFIRPGALHTAKDAIAGCFEVFGEMEMLIEEGRKGLGKFILPFKESKIQLLNARLASLKSTLQLLLQVLQYASRSNLDPNVSQLSLSGSWVMSQFKILIDEREEAKRKLEQLKAEIGSINSGIAEPSSSSSKAQQKPAAATEEARPDLQFTLTPTPEVKLAGYQGQNLPVGLPDSVLNATPTAQAKPNKPNLTRANAEPDTGHCEMQQGSSSVKLIPTWLGTSLTTLLCYPCISCYKFSRSRNTYNISLMEVNTNLDTGGHRRPEIGPYPQSPQESAYGILETYGPEGVFELAGEGPISEIPAPEVLDSRFLAEIDRNPYSELGT